MSYCGISIFSNNLSGQTANVTFYPSSGGTIELGEQTFPFSYITDYWYGTYDCYVPTYAYTYVVDVPLPSPTPTVTTTSTPTNTPTPSVTNGLTPTPTETTTPTQTPTNTETPTQTPTNTETQTNTPTQTPTNTETPTNTPTNTETPTQTASPTVTPSGVVLYPFNCIRGEISPYDACNGSNGATLYGPELIFDENVYFFNTSIGGIVGNISGYYNFSGTLAELDIDGNVLGFSLCSLLPTNTPTPTTTQTPTNTPTNTETQTPTPTNTETQTPTQTPTQTQTPTITQTPTSINYVFELIYGSNPNEACSGTDSTFYGTRSGGPTLDIGEILYTNAETTTPAPDGFYAAGTAIYFVSGGNGEITQISLDGCLTLTTPTPTITSTPTPTPTITETPTQTPTQTPSSPFCKRYSFNGGTTDTLFAGIDCNGFDYSFTVAAGDTYIGCVATYIVADGNGFATYINPC